MSDPELIIDRNSLKLPPVSLTMTVLIVLVGVLSWLKPLSVGALFAMHPLSVMPPKFHLWTLVTFVFVDLDPVNFFITLVSFPIFAKALETAYGGLALARYLAIVVVATGSVLFLVGLVEPLFVKNMVLWSETPKSALYGAQPIMIACLVAMKQVMKKKGGKKKKNHFCSVLQLMPETYLSIFFLFKLRLGWLPTFAITLTTLSGVLMPSRGIVAMWLALFISWIYLRFVATFFSQSAAGDLRESFGLASFFPAAAQPYVLPLSRWIDARRFWPAHRVSAAVSVLPLDGAVVIQKRRKKDEIMYKLIFFFDFLFSRSIKELRLLHLFLLVPQLRENCGQQRLN